MIYIILYFNVPLSLPDVVVAVLVVILSLNVVSISDVLGTIIVLLVIVVVVVVITTPASPLPIELVATTENV